MIVKYFLKWLDLLLVVMCLAGVPESSLEMCMAQVHLASVVSDVKGIA